MKLTRFFFCTALALSALLFASCRPSISVKALGDDSATILFTTGFSESAARLLHSLTGSDESVPLLNKADVLAVLEAVGAVDTSVTIPKSTEITATGTVPQLSKNRIVSSSGILKTDAHSLTLTLGGTQFAAFYELLNDEAKSYFDLLMIPALIGEKMTVAEYKELLASMYGPTFADEIVNGTVSIHLSSSDGRKKHSETMSLGEILTLTEETSWTLRF